MLLLVLLFGSSLLLFVRMVEVACGNGGVSMLLIVPGVVGVVVVCARCCYSLYLLMLAIAV